MVEIALIVVEDNRGSLWTVPVSRIAKMKMKNNELKVFLENDDMEYTLIQEGVYVKEKAVMRNTFRAGVRSVMI